MESIKQVLSRKPQKQTRLVFLLVSTAIIVATSLFAYDRISYQFPLSVGNTGQSALGPPTSAGVGIAYAVIVFAAILGFGAVLSIYGSLRNVSEKITDKITEIVVREPAKDSVSKPQEKPEWEDASTAKQSKATDEDILQALLHSKDEKKADTE
ncbi:MAG TPA: hypothetical protein VFV92_02350 [Candidatus Bathyarchaeia archaeon]|nr:hypothetical protein [Candidatus Bathyarchaeia archaeon]